MKRMVIDVGGTAIKYALMDGSFRTSDAGEVPTPQDTQEHFFSVVEQLYREYGAGTDGIAMSLPGFIRRKTGRCEGGGALIYNRYTDIAGPLSGRCGCTVRIANDGKSAALAELRAGSLRGCGNAGVYILGTGVGGGLIIDGKVIDGVHGTAGEYSFLRSREDEWDDPEATVGMNCSTTGLLNLYRKYAGFAADIPVDGRFLFGRVLSGEETAQRALKDFCRKVVRNIANLTILLDLEKVAVGGGISSQPVLLETLREAQEELYANAGIYFDPGLHRAELVPCRFGSEANMVGAYLYYDAI